MMPMGASSVRLQDINVPRILLVLMCLVLASTFWAKSYVTSMRRSFESIYNDRLIPATDLFHISDHLHDKRLIAERVMHGATPTADLRRELVAHDEAIAEFIDEIEHTYLVGDESESLRSLRVNLANYDAYENALLDGTTSPEIAYGLLVEKYAEIRRDLLHLSEIQTTVGKELTKDSASLAYGFHSLNELQLALLALLCLGAQALLLNTRRNPPARSAQASPSHLH